MQSIASVLFACFLLISCGEKKNKGEFGEGEIEFDTKAVDPTHPLAGLAPGTATLRFKNEMFMMEMSTMGMFNTMIIGDTKKKTLAQTIKFMDIKQACIENEQDISKENASYRLIIEETKETKEMLGMKAIKLKVTMATDPSRTFDAYYTKDLGMENCNALTPYASVKGVLLDYRVKRMGMEMRFVARSYKNVEVSENIFEIPAYMKIVSKAEMEKFFLDLQY
ncbi:MAG: hypothetical protein AB7O73_02070 [Bacteroidia bacterium]